MKRKGYKLLHVITSLSSSWMKALVFVRETESAYSITADGPASNRECVLQLITSSRLCVETSATTIASFTLPSARDAASAGGPGLFKPNISV